MNTNSIVMCETLPSNADWDCFKTQILQEILRIQNLLRVEHCAFFLINLLGVQGGLRGVSNPRRWWQEGGLEKERP